MKLLLDTHVAIWVVSAPEMLSPAVAKMLVDPANESYVSVASIWEIAIKFATGRVNAIPFGGHEAIRQFKRAGCRFLDISLEHAAATEGLKTPHKDPFDRLLIAQAVMEPLTLVTRDSKVASYSPTFITW